MSAVPERLGPYAVMASDAGVSLRRRLHRPAIVRAYWATLVLLAAVGPVGALVSRDGALIVGGVFVFGSLAALLRLGSTIEASPYGEVFVQARRTVTIEAPAEVGYREASAPDLIVDGTRFPLDVRHVATSRAGQDGAERWWVFVVLRSAVIEVYHCADGEEAAVVADRFATLLKVERVQIPRPIIVSSRLFWLVGQTMLEVVALSAFVLANLDVMSRSLVLLAPALWSVGLASFHWVSGRLLAPWVRGDSDPRVRRQFGLQR